MILPTLRFENVFIAMIPSPKNVSLATKIMAVGQLDPAKRPGNPVCLRDIKMLSLDSSTSKMWV